MADEIGDNRISQPRLGLAGAGRQDPEPTLARLLYRGRPECGFADAGFPLDYEGRRLLSCRHQEVDNCPPLNRTVDDPPEHPSNRRTRQSRCAAKSVISQLTPTSNPPSAGRGGLPRGDTTAAEAVRQRQSAGGTGGNVRETPD